MYFLNTICTHVFGFSTSPLQSLTVTVIPSSALRIVPIGIVAALVIVGAALSMVIRLWQPQPLAAFIPASRTAALFSGMPRDTLASFADLYPILRSLPSLPQETDIALLTTPTGSLTWVASSPSEEHPLPASNIRIGRQQFLAADPSVEHLLTARGDDVLAQSPAHMNAMENIPARTHTVWLQRDDLQALLPENVLLALAAVGTVRGPLLLRVTPGGASLRVPMDALPMGREAPDALPRLAPPPDAVFSLSAPEQLMDRALVPLSPDRREILRGMLSARARELAGKDVSFPYDLLPLLQEPAIIAFGGRSGTGVALAFALSTSLPTRGEAEHRLESLHESFRRQLQSSRVLRRTLEKGIESATLQIDPSNVLDVRSAQGGWTVRATQEREGSRALMSAVRGREIVLGNDPAWVEQFLQNAATIDLPRSRGVLVAGGILRAGALGDLVGEKASPVWTVLRGNAGSDVGWSIAADGSTATLAVEFPQHLP